ncbi:MAG: hypothetical protein Kow00109_27950 [Acidobacteriota bacterium]
MEANLIAQALLTTTLVTMGVPVRAEVIPGRWEKLEEQRRHLPLSIHPKKRRSPARDLSGCD